MPTNVDDFNTGVALIMGKLYKTFPKPITLCGNELPEISFTEDDPDLNEKIDRHVDLSNIYFYTIIFLLDEGYLRGEKVEGRTFLHECTLTSKGLAALQRTPQALRTSQSSVGAFFASLGMDATREVTKEAVKAGVRALLSGG